jgi:hypothetical protein
MMTFGIDRPAPSPDARRWERRGWDSRRAMSDPIGVFGVCCMCKEPMWLPLSLERTAQALSGSLVFYCAYGHGQVYRAGETEETKLRRERDRLAQQIAQKDDEIADQRRRLVKAENEASDARKKASALRKRASAGTCPCCNRSFSALAQHIATKHPAFRAEDVTRENVVSIIKARSS